MQSKLFRLSSTSQRSTRLLLISAVASVCCTQSAFAQTAYFSTQGNFTAAAPTQDLYFDLSRAVTSSETFRFETFSGRGTTLNAAGDTSPTSPTIFDSVLTLTKSGAAIGSNDDGAAGSNTDALLSWPGVADSGGTLGAGPIAAGTDYRLRLTEFNNETGPWGVDLVGPANAITFRDFDPFASAASPSNVRSIKFGTNGTAVVGAPAAQRATFKPTNFSAANYQLTGDLVVAQTGNASFIMDSTDGDRFTVAGATTVKVGGDVTLSGNATLNANGGLLVDGGRVALSGTSMLRRTGAATIWTLNNGGRIDVNTGATLDAPNADVEFGATGNTVESSMGVVNGIVNTKSSSIGRSPGLNARATINGAAGRWNLSEDLYVGALGNGILEIATGAIVSDRDGWIGFAVGGVGTASVTGAGSTWTSTRNLSLGDVSSSGVGTLTIASGGALRVGDTTGFSGFGIVVNDVNTLGGDGGELYVYNGSALTNTSALPVLIGNANQYGKVRVSGTNSTWTNNHRLFMASGANAKGMMDITSGGQVTFDMFANVGVTGGLATLNVDGANSLFWTKNNLSLGDGSGGRANVTLTNGGDLRVGDRTDNFSTFDVFVSDNDPIGTAGGVMSILNGSQLTSSQNSMIGFNGGSGRVVISGLNSKWTASGQLSVANAGTGDLQILSQAAASATFLVVGDAQNAAGTVTVSGGGVITTSVDVQIANVHPTISLWERSAPARSTSVQPARPARRAGSSGWVPPPSARSIFPMQARYWTSRKT